MKVLKNIGGKKVHSWGWKALLQKGKTQKSNHKRKVYDE